MTRLSFWALALAVLPLPAFAQQIQMQDLDALPGADVVILGEVHDNPAHHTAQARAVAALQPKAVIWEMLTPEQASDLPPDLADADLVANAVGWAASGWPEFALYHPIMLAAPAALHFGAGVSRDRARRVFDAPLAEVFGEGAARFGLDAAVPEAETETRLTDLTRAHCNALPEALLPGMLAAQRLRDAELARAVLNALDRTGGPVAVITGNGHARADWGVPALIARADPLVRVLSIGMLEAEPDAAPPFDLWLITPPVARADPCAAFR